MDHPGSRSDSHRGDLWYVVDRSEYPRLDRDRSWKTGCGREWGSDDSLDRLPRRRDRDRISDVWLIRSLTHRWWSTLWDTSSFTLSTPRTQE